MFYCDGCAKARQWPETFAKSHGACEQCGNVAVCNDLPMTALTRHEQLVEQYGSIEVAQKARFNRRKTAMIEVLERGGIDADSAYWVVEILTDEGLPELLMLAAAVPTFLTGKRMRTVNAAINRRRREMDRDL